MKTFIFTDKELNIKAVIQAKSYEIASDILYSKLQASLVDSLIYAGQLENTTPTNHGAFYFLGN